MKISDLHKGMSIYIPLPIRKSYISTGNSVLGQSSYTKYKSYKLTVSDVARIEFPSTEDSSYLKPWYDGYKSTAVQFDLSSLNENEQKVFHDMFSSHGYYPCMWDNDCLPTNLENKHQTFINYLSFPDDMSPETDYYAYDSFQLFSSTEKEAKKAIHKLNNATLSSIKRVIKNYIKLYFELKRWFKKPVTEQEPQ